MDVAQTLLDVIDARSFSNVWYWIILAIMWSTATHYTLGVPYDMVQRSRRLGEEAQDDLMAIIGINIRRILYLIEVSGIWMIGVWAFLLSGLLLLAFYYWIEFAQSVALMFVPMTIVGWLTYRTAMRIHRQGPDAEQLHVLLMRHRFWIHVIGMISIFITAIFGMYHNLDVADGF